MTTIAKFEDLAIWQNAREFCKHIFDLTQNSDFATAYKFKDQIRASSGSIMDNIAEGFERDGNKEFIQFLFIAKASCGETRSQLYPRHLIIVISRKKNFQICTRKRFLYPDRFIILSVI